MTHWSHSLPGHRLACVEGARWLFQHFPPGPGSHQPAVPQAPLNSSAKPGLNRREGSRPHLREAPGMAEWVKNTGTQKPLNAHGNRNGGAGEYTENWARSAEGKGEIRLAGTLAEKLLGATPKPPPAQVSIPGDPAPPPLPERNPAPTCSLPPPR